MKTKFIAIFIAIFSLLVSVTAPTYAVPSGDLPVQNVTVTDAEARELVRGFEKAGFIKTAKGSSQADIIVLTKGDAVVTFSKKNSALPTQGRNDTDRWVVGTIGLFYGTDAWGFYIKMEWYYQFSLAVATTITPAVAVKLPVALILGVIQLGLRVAHSSAEGMAKDLFDIALGLCPPFQPRYIRFDPFRTKCG